MQPNEEKDLQTDDKDARITSGESVETNDKKDPKVDENVESSSTGSDGGKGGGSGSGGGYSADCSSSDASSLEAAKGSVPDKEIARLNINSEGESAPETASKELKSNKNPKVSGQKVQKGLKRSNDQNDIYESSLKSNDLLSDVNPQWNLPAHALRNEASLPQWNGIRVRHPMDPRIDISTVGHIQTSALSAFPSDEADLPAHSEPEEKDCGVDNPSESSEPPPPPSIDQYMKLMEVVRPFFHAHGISHEGIAHTKSDDPSNERPSSDFATEPSDSDQKRSGAKLKVPIAAWNTAHNAAAPSSYASYPPRDMNESDSSSMVVLARVKRKHLKKTGEDSANDGSTNNSTNDGSNFSSSSDRQVETQQQHQREAKAEPQNEDAGSNEDDSNDNSGEADENVPQVHAAHQQETTSASSSEDRNNQEGPEAAPLRYGVPAVVSEYSSSRTGSSGASNNNLMSTSGSGSGGNTGSGTGSGTASGSNQGGSCGSGNDQGISSNGIGSSGSGNDVKGSSEETMDNSGENNSGENSGENSGGNSDATNPNNRKDKSTVSTPADVPHVSSAHRHMSNTPETASRELAVQPQQKPLHSEDNATREKKLQDKKRKRMNMRREYEEKVQQEMESSESSRDRGETAIRPGRPVTLDKVLSFTKIPRIVIKEGPPFLVVYTNAAYCRLTGVDSHVAVGKPISSLLSIPEGELVADTGQNNTASMSNPNSIAAAKAGGDEIDTEQNTQMLPDDLSTGASINNNYGFPDAGTRTRALASRQENTEMCLERLVAASGFGRCHVINARTRPRQMIGRNVSLMKPSIGAPARTREEGGGNANTNDGQDGSLNMLPCSMSVAPVVSSPEAFNVAVVTDKDQDSYHHKTKRRKHHHHNDSQPSSAVGHHQHRRNHMLREVSMHRRRHLITHYVIQLEPFEGGLRQNGAGDSQSSTSTTVEANILGLTKSELRRQRLRTASHTNAYPDEGVRQQADDNDEDMESESTDPKEPVTAIG